MPGFFKEQLSPVIIPKESRTENKKAKVINKRGIENPKNPDRRQFLRGLGALTAILAVPETISKLSKSYLGALNDEKEEPRVNITEEAEEEVEEEDPIKIEDKKSASQILNYNELGRIKINIESLQSLENFLEDQYRNNPKLRDSLFKAYKEMGPWEEELKQIFLDEGLSPDLRYLAIPESHWDYFADSGFAVGTYQFTKETGKEYGLMIEKFIDERKDPIKAGRACAKFIKHLLKRSNNDERLALSGYNGGYFGRFLKTNPSQISYEEFARYLEVSVNELRDKINNSGFYLYRVKDGDSLSKIARNFKANKQEVIALNFKNPKKINLVKGASIKIPTNTAEQKKNCFDYMVADYAQNINYPAKYNVIVKLINEGINIERDRERPKNWQYLAMMNTPKKLEANRREKSRLFAKN